MPILAGRQCFSWPVLDGLLERYGKWRDYERKSRNEREKRSQFPMFDHELTPHCSFFFIWRHTATCTTPPTTTTTQTSSSSPCPFGQFFESTPTQNCEICSMGFQPTGEYRGGVYCWTDCCVARRHRNRHACAKDHNIRVCKTTTKINRTIVENKQNQNLHF
jgi:hypothetical protein